MTGSYCMLLLRSTTNWMSIVETMTCPITCLGKSTYKTVYGDYTLEPELIMWQPRLQNHHQASEDQNEAAAQVVKYYVHMSN